MSIKIQRNFVAFLWVFILSELPLLLLVVCLVVSLLGLPVPLDREHPDGKAWVLVSSFLALLCKKLRKSEKCDWVGGWMRGWTDGLFDGWVDWLVDE